MTSLNISLPESMRTWIDEQVAKGGYGTASEFLRQLIREAQRQQSEDRLEALLLQGLDSGPATEMTNADWDRLKQRARERREKRGRK
jgi:antitoxin ParD1/3/4